jgi:hypothetical protein
MKQLINEIKRMQQLAGLLKENDQPGADITPEKAAEVATKLTDKIENNPKVIKFADAIAKDPIASKQLMDLLAKYNVSLNEDVDSSDVHSLALAFAKKAETLKEDESTAELGLLGLLGGITSGALASKYLTYNIGNIVQDLTSSGISFIQHKGSIIPYLSADQTIISAAILGVLLTVVAGLIMTKPTK